MKQFGEDIYQCIKCWQDPPQVKYKNPHEAPDWLIEKNQPTLLQ